MNWRNTLLLCMSVIVLVVVLAWPRNGGCASKEGFEANREYIYTPNRDTPEISMKIQINYVIDETIKLFEFFKRKRGLVYRPPAPLPEPPVQDDMYVDDSDEALGLSAPAPAGAPREKFVGDITLDVDENKEYQGNITTLDLANKYNKFKENIDAELDKSFALYFLKENVTTAHFTRFAEAVSFYTNEYAYVQYFAVSPQDEYKPTQFVDTWRKLLKDNATSPGELENLKKTFYEMIGNSFLFTKFVEYFRNNAKMYAKKDDALFVVNAGIRHMKDLMGPTTTGFGASEFNTDALRLTNVSIIVSELFQLVLQSNKYPEFKYDYTQFVADYENSPKTPKPSVYLFLMKNPIALPAAPPLPTAKSGKK
jgi:hypothetical protein